MNDIRFRTFNIVEDSFSDPICKIVAVTIPNEDKTEFTAQFAFCSPKDNFNKAKGRDIAIKRLNSYRGIVFKYDGTKRVTDILKELIIEEINRKPIYWLRGITKDIIR